MIDGAEFAAAELMFTVKVFAALPALFLACIVIVYDPAVAGVPDRVPDVLSVKPGMLPAVSVHVMGAVPEAISVEV